PIQPLPPKSLEVTPWPSLATLGKMSDPGSQPRTCLGGCSEGKPDSLRIVEGLTLPTKTNTTGRLGVGLRPLGLLLLISTIGCSHEPYNCQDGLTQRILPPPSIDIHEELPPPRKPDQDGSGVSQARPTPNGESGVPRAQSVATLQPQSAAFWDTFRAE